MLVRTVAVARCAPGAARRRVCNARERGQAERAGQVAVGAGRERHCAQTHRCIRQDSALDIWREVWESRAVGGHHCRHKTTNYIAFTSRYKFLYSNISFRVLLYISSCVN